jgi:uncharacterized YigZ family protein
MKVIKENIINKLEVNKSIFYTDLIKVYSKDDVINELNNIKNKYKDATHYCYAYIIDDTKKSSDDGEPGGTAGVPIMETLNNKDLNYILCVVTRYFGGIKLGAGGLVRAYRKATIEAINNSTLLDLIDGYEIIIKISYNEQKDLEYLLKDNFKKEYDNDVTYTIKCNKDIKEILEKKYNILSVKEIKIEKEN